MPPIEGQSALCNSWKLELAQGVHLPGDTYNIALYTSSATISKATTVYTNANEVANGNGYAQGGIALQGFSATLSGDYLVIDFNDPVWPESDITAKLALIYNASKSNKAVCVIDFGQNISSSFATFTVQFSSNGVIRLI